jgi:hypothetical protein
MTLEEKARIVCWILLSPVIIFIIRGHIAQLIWEREYRKKQKLKYRQSVEEFYAWQAARAEERRLEEEKKRTQQQQQQQQQREGGDQ